MLMRQNAQIKCAKHSSLAEMSIHTSESERVILQPILILRKEALHHSPVTSMGQY